jgi:hypothetical protein
MKGQSDNQPQVRYITTNTFLCETVININNFITLKNFKILKLLTRGEIYANIIGTANICLKEQQILVNSSLNKKFKPYT